MAISQCQPLYSSWAVFIDSDRSFSQEQLTKEHLLLVLTFISLRSSWPRRAWRVWRLPKDKPPEEGLGLKLSLFLLWFWLSIFVVVDANLELRLLVFKQSCKAWCLNCCRSPEQRGLETAMADPNWKATSLWNRTQVQKVKVVQKQKPWLEKLSWIFWHKTLRSKKVIHSCQRTQSICGSSKMCEKQENKTQNSEYSYYVTLPYDGSMDVILNSISTAGETWNVHLWGKRSHSPHAYSVFFQCDPQFILRMVISWYATIMITIILLNIIEVIIGDATIVQPQGLFNI